MNEVTAPRVSVLMAAYNGGALIRHSIESLLAQTFEDFEVVVVDDGSTDGTVATIECFQDPRVRLIRNPDNLGVVGARNRAFEHARGNYIAILDQDDLSRPDRLAAQVAFLDAHPGAVMVASDVDIIENGAERPSGRVYGDGGNANAVKWMLHIGNPLYHSSIMYRGAAARRLGEYLRKDYELCEDYEFYIRLLGQGEIAIMPERLTVIREHSGRASKRFTEALNINAVKLLRDLYAPELGGDAQEAAVLVINHLASGDPVPDAAALARLGGLLDRLVIAFTANLPARDRTAIADYSGHLWWRLVRASLRAGRLPLFGGAFERPKVSACGRMGRLDIVLSAFVGLFRRAAS